MVGIGEEIKSSIISTLILKRAWRAARLGESKRFISSQNIAKNSFGSSD